MVWLVGTGFAERFSVAVVVNLGGEQKNKRVVVGMCRLFFWLKSKEVPQRTRPLVFSVVSIVPIRRWRSATEEADGARACEAGDSFKIITQEIPFMKLLVVTAMAAWFNFRAWQKRL